jgi:hypothetical protein
MEMSDIAGPIPIDSKVSLILVTEKQLPAPQRTDFSARRGYTGAILTARVGKKTRLDT